MEARYNTYAKKHSVNGGDENDTSIIGCIVLNEVKFFKEHEFLSTEQLGISFPPQVVKLKYFDHDIPALIKNLDQIVLPGEETSNNKVLIEGGKKRILVNAYERNPIARNKCIEPMGLVVLYVILTLRNITEI
ncbi:hypothetical protein [Oceanobacillus salinisoli]|uniref:hypothetical protein n=1 Tax=Oceanobacillus salinisoli TaxID=2678611 RepID=UPI001E598E48|nr:hypothetical protein [Oceanobacillus salinisoli]